MPMLSFMCPLFSCCARTERYNAPLILRTLALEDDMGELQWMAIVSVPCPRSSQRDVTPLFKHFFSRFSLFA